MSAINNSPALWSGISNRTCPTAHCSMLWQAGSRPRTDEFAGALRYSSESLCFRTLYARGVCALLSSRRSLAFKVTRLEAELAPERNHVLGAQMDNGAGARKIPSHVRHA